MAAAFGLIGAPLKSRASADDVSSAERMLFEYANHERQQQHIGLLKWDSALAAAARLHSEKMARENTISHQFPGEPEFSVRAISAGAKFNAAAENVGEGPSIMEIHIGWMNSLGHRANLLNPQLDSLGVGVVVRGSQYFATQDFSKAIETLSLKEQEKRFGDLIMAKGLRLEVDASEARKICSSGELNTPTKRATYRLVYVTADLASLPEKLLNEILSGKYRTAAVGACSGGDETKTGMYRLSVLLY